MRICIPPVPADNLMSDFGIQRTAIQGWASETAALLQSLIDRSLLDKGSCNVMLTGGFSAAYLYQAWTNKLDQKVGLSRVQFFFGDERCVPPNHPESNYGNAVGCLFSNGIPNDVRIHRMMADDVDLEAAADSYADLLPEFIDILLLSMGEDGHIASLFPHSTALLEMRRRVLPVIGPKAPFKRLTITPSVIQSACEVVVLALGEQKRVLYKEALRNAKDINSIPARLVLNRTWIFGD